jgi:hypothetical protein
MTPNDQSSVDYELTVAGTLGPVFRHALAPHTTAASETCTILLADVSDEDDLVDLVGTLEERGLEVEGIIGLDHPAKRDDASEARG